MFPSHCLASTTGRTAIVIDTTETNRLEVACANGRCKAPSADGPRSRWWWRPVEASDRPAVLWVTAVALLSAAWPQCSLAGEQTQATAVMPAAGDLAQAEGADVRLRLSGGTFDQRQEAMWDLWRNRPTHREAVIRAARDHDPEVSSRAQWVIDRWRRGILPETPLDLARQLESASHSDSLQRLLDLGLFDGARVAIQEAAQAGDQGTLGRVASVVQRGFPFYIRSADSQGQLKEFADLLDRLATTAEMMICRDQVWALLGRDVVAGTSTEGEPATEPQGQQRMRVAALAAAGRLDLATQAAGEADDPELLRVCQLLQADWAGLAQTQLQAIGQQDSESTENDRHWAYLLVAASRLGDSELRDRAVAKLSRRPSDRQKDAAEDPFLRLRWQVLAMHGEIDAAVEILTPTHPLIAAEILAQAGRLSDAMAVIDFDLQDVDAQIPELIAAARSAAQSWTPSQIRAVPEPLERLIAVARLLYLAGHRDASWDLFAGVAAASSEEEDASLALSRDLVLRALERLGRSDWVARMIIQNEGVSLSETGRYFLARALDVQPETIDALVVSIGQLHPRSGTVLAQAVIDLLSGDVPQNFDPQQDYKRLFELLSGQRPRISRGDVRRASSSDSPHLNLEIAKLFELHGQVELAKKSLIHLASAGETEAILEFADAELKEGRVQSAKSLFEAVWKRVDQQRQDPARLNRAEDDALVAMRAVLGEAIAAGRLGDQEGADQLWRLIDLMACSPSAKLRDLFGAHLLDQGYDAQAEKIYRVLVPWVAFGSDEGVQFYGVVRNFNRSIDNTDPALASQVFDLAIAGTIESTVFYPAAYVSLPAYVHRKKILASIAAGDTDAVGRHIDAVLRLGAIDIDLGEKAVEKMRAAGMKQLADQTVERIYQSGKEHLEQFPLDIITANNLAWILALSDHRLDEALIFSRRAVYFAPDSTVYRDTLAEVLFRLGRVEEAIAIEKAGLIDQPGEWHMHQQLRRFEAAAPGQD